MEWPSSPMSHPWPPLTPVSNDEHFSEHFRSPSELIKHLDMLEDEEDAVDRDIDLDDDETYLRRSNGTQYTPNSLFGERSAALGTLNGVGERPIFYTPKKEQSEDEKDADSNRQGHQKSSSHSDHDDSLITSESMRRSPSPRDNSHDAFSSNSPVHNVNVSPLSSDASTSSAVRNSFVEPSVSVDDRVSKSSSHSNHDDSLITSESMRRSPSPRDNSHEAFSSNSPVHNVNMSPLSSDASTYSAVRNSFVEPSVSVDDRVSKSSSHSDHDDSLITSESIRRSPSPRDNSHEAFSSNSPVRNVNMSPLSSDASTYSAVRNSFVEPSVSVDDRVSKSSSHSDHDDSLITSESMRRSPSPRDNSHEAFSSNSPVHNVNMSPLSSDASTYSAVRNSFVEPSVSVDDRVSKSSSHSDHDDSLITSESIRRSPSPRDNSHEAFSSNSPVHNVNMSPLSSDASTYSAVRNSFVEPSVSVDDRVSKSSSHSDHDDSLITSESMRRSPSPRDNSHEAFSSNSPVHNVNMSPLSSDAPTYSAVRNSFVEPSVSVDHTSVYNTARPSNMPSTFERILICPGLRKLHRYCHFSIDVERLKQNGVLCSPLEWLESIVARFIKNNDLHSRPIHHSIRTAAIVSLPKPSATFTVFFIFDYPVLDPASFRISFAVALNSACRGALDGDMRLLEMRRTRCES